jgi:hypothetical protein
MKTPIEQRLWEEVRRAFSDLTTDRTRRGMVHFKAKIFQGLAACRKDLAAHFRLPESELQCFYTVGDKGATGKAKNTEYMGFDFTWTTYPRGRRFGYRSAGTTWPSSKYRILLAAESEAAGPRLSLARFLDKVLEDFIKLLDVKGSLKVLVYRPPQADWARGFEVAQRAIQDVIARHHYGCCSKSEKWMFIGIPWYRTRFPRSGSLCAQVHLLTYDGEPRLTVAPWPC